MQERSLSHSRLRLECLVYHRTRLIVSSILLASLRVPMLPRDATSAILPHKVVPIMGAGQQVAKCSCIMDRTGYSCDSLACGADCRARGVLAKESVHPISPDPNSVS